MRYEELNPNYYKLTVVFGGTADERNAFQAAFLKKYPDHQTEMHPCLKNYKKPLLRQKPIIDYLTKQAKDNPRRMAAPDVKAAIRNNAKALNVDQLLNRYVPALSERQKFLFSLLLEQRMKTNMKLFVRDDQGPLKENDCAMIADWFFRIYGDVHAVILTESIMENVDTYDGLRNRAIFYQLEQGELTQYNIRWAYNLRHREEIRRANEEERRAKEAEEAKQGDAADQFNRGKMYDYGKGTAVDKAKALMWYEKAAQQGDTDAQFRCGEMYYKGEGTAVDKSKALYWFQKSALQANHLAMVYLAGMYRRGDGTDVNKTEAFALYGILAMVGVPSAQYICGEMCYNGEGIKKDMDEAKMWYEKAARQTQNKDIQEKAKKALREYF